VHFDNAATQLTAKEDCGAMKVSSPAFVRPKSRAVVDLLLS